MRHDPIVRLLRDFRDDRKGNFGLLFAGTAFMLLIAAGTAVDITRAYTDKSDMSNALDAAVLATAQSISAGGCSAGTGATQAMSEAAAQQCLDAFVAVNMQNSPDQAGASKIATEVHIDGATNTVTASAILPYKAAFGIFGKAGEFPISSSASASYGDGKAEVAMTFDLTGSMEGSKLTSLKSAAKTGITTLLQANAGGETRVRIAEIPYAASVNVGPELAQYVWRDDGDPKAIAPKYVEPASGSGLTVGVNLGGVGAGVSLGGSSGSGVSLGGSSGGGLLNVSLGGGSSGSGNAQYGGSSQSASNTRYCATERKGPEQFTDAGPEDGMVNLDGDVSPDGCPSAKVIPLTADANTLLDEIDNFTAGGNTAGHIGIQWAWYMLSNKWASYLPSGTGASPSSDKKIHKYLIIMTDGMFNQLYSGFKPNDDDGYTVSATSSNDARDLCSRIKADGIQIFAVGFNLNDSTATATLKACASPDAGGVKFFYNASGGSQLESIYKQIAAAIQRLRLVS